MRAWATLQTSHYTISKLKTMFMTNNLVKRKS